jgi:FAD/FMN-containing dehydrogenase
VWTVAYWEALRPHAREGAYVNFIGQDGQERVRPSYGPNYDRLADLKGKYDPENIFHVNQNIVPPR